jgi:hypothetical protein
MDFASLTVPANHSSCDTARLTTTSTHGLSTISVSSSESHGYADLPSGMTLVRALLLLLDCLARDLTVTIVC